jgi:hypothetical protein
MQTESKCQERIAALHKEMDSIHYANNLSWQQMIQNDAAKADFYRRQDRLEEVRAELDILRKSPTTKKPGSSFTLALQAYDRTSRGARRAAQLFALQGSLYKPRSGRPRRTENARIAMHVHSGVVRPCSRREMPPSETGFVKTFGKN